MKWLDSLLLKLFSLSWRSAIWLVNGFFLVMTVIVAQLPGSDSSSRHGLVQYLGQFTLAEEKNLPTYSEGMVSAPGSYPSNPAQIKSAQETSWRRLFIDRITF
jgi:hypothetical protein